MKRSPTLLTSLLLAAVAGLTSAAPGARELTRPIAGDDLVFEEVDGLLAIEAEHFFKQEKDGVRAWYLTTRDRTPDLAPDGDPSHIAGASGGAYLEILPDTRRNHGQKLIHGENFSNQPGVLAILSYNAYFNTPGTYHLWARAFSTTTEDNGLHFGIDGEWPETAQRWQTVTKNRWHWQSRQRTAEVHVGVPGILTLDVKKPGPHTLHVSMREDGIALDRILLVNRKGYKPEGLGPAAQVRSGKLPPAYPVVAAAPQAAAPAAPRTRAPRNKPVPAGGAVVLEAADLLTAGTNYYLDRDRWLAIDPASHKAAETATAFPSATGIYDITLHAVGENDGKSTYEVLLNDVVAGRFTSPLSRETYEEGPRFTATWKTVKVAAGDVIKVRSEVGSEDGEEFSRARVARLVFTPADAATRRAPAAVAAATPAPPPRPRPPHRPRPARR